MRKPAGQLSGSNTMMKRAAARWFCWRMRPICRFTGAGSSLFFERAIRAARRSSAASMRALNLSCMAFYLLRRSAERHTITVSSVSGWRVSLTSTPSSTVRQPSGRASSQPNFFSSDLGAPASLPQPREIVSARHAAIGDPDTPQHAMPGLHGRDNRLQRPRIMGITGKHLVAEGKAVKGDDKRDQDLLAVGAMVTRVAPLRLRVGFRLAFEIGAGHIVEQHLVLDGEQLAAALRQMRFQRGLVGEEMIKPAIEPILGDRFVEAAANRSAPCGGTSPRRCAVRSTARTTAPPPARPPSSPRRRVPPRREWQRALLA